MSRMMRNDGNGWIPAWPLKTCAACGRRIEHDIPACMREHGIPMSQAEQDRQFAEYERRSASAFDDVSTSDT